MAPTLLLPWLLGCPLPPSDPAGEGSPPSTHESFEPPTPDPGGPTPPESAPLPEIHPQHAGTAADSCSPLQPPSMHSLHLEQAPEQELALIAEVSLSAPAPLALRCTDRADADEVLWAESAEPTSEHRLRLYGLAPERTYHCEAATLCPGLPAARAAADHHSPGLPDDLPLPTASQHSDRAPASPPWVVTNPWRYCDGGGPQRFVLYDLEGVPRWVHHEVPGDVDGSLELRYLGDGEWLWGGGLSMGGDPRLMSMAGEELYVSSYPGSADRVFHHEARRLEDGRILSLAEAEDTIDGSHVNGFIVEVHEPSSGVVEHSYSSQQAALDGYLAPDGSLDPYHANAAQVVGDLLLISLCTAQKVLAVELATGEMQWVFGPGGDLELLDAEGQPLPDSEWPQCQHDPELEGNRLVVYDNGHDRGQSRVAAYDLDPEAGTATRVWSWEGPEPFFEWSLGDVDLLPEGRVHITQGHLECWLSTPGDTSSLWELDPARGELIWSLDFPSVHDAIYRSQRVQVCDQLRHERFCPEVRRRAEELEPFFG